MTTGPEIIGAVFSGPFAVIHDPVSFPWGLDEPEHWRTPALFDLSGCSGDDITALVNHLVVTPEDRLVLAPEHRTRIESALSLPGSVFLDAMPADPESVLAPLAAAKLRRSLLREVLEPMIRQELGSVAGFGDDASRPLRVLDIGAADTWRASLVPEPHSYVTDVLPERAEIVIVEADALDAEALGAIVPGGLVLVVLDESLPPVMDRVDELTGPNRVVEHVWGLHSSPGRPTLGGVIGVRPLAAP